MAYPIQYRSPSLHGDTLEHGEHGETDVVKGGDAIVRTLPPLQTHRVAVATPIAPLQLRLRLIIGVAGCRCVALLNNFICSAARINKIKSSIIAAIRSPAAAAWVA